MLAGIRRSPWLPLQGVLRGLSVGQGLCRDRSGAQLLGEVDPTSGYGADGWFWRFRHDFAVYRDRAVADLRPYEPACFIVSHIAFDEDKVLLAALSKDRTCTLGAAAKGARLFVCRATAAAQLR